MEDVRGNVPLCESQKIDHGTCAPECGEEWHVSRELEACSGRHPKLDAFNSSCAIDSPPLPEFLRCLCSDAHPQ